MFKFKKRLIVIFRKIAKCFVQRDSIHKEKTLESKNLQNRSFGQNEKINKLQEN